MTTFSDWQAEQKLKLKLELLAPEIDAAIATQRETTEIITHMTDDAHQKLADAKARQAEADRLDIAWKNARYGQTGEG